MVQRAPDPLNVAIFLQKVHSEDLSCAMRRHILRQPEGISCALDIFPYGLPGAVVAAVPACEDPPFPGGLLKVTKQRLG